MGSHGLLVTITIIHFKDGQESGEQKMITDVRVFKIFNKSQILCEREQIPLSRWIAEITFSKTYSIEPGTNLLRFSVKESILKL